MVSCAQSPKRNLGTKSFQMNEPTLSDHCLVDHSVEASPDAPPLHVTPRMILGFPMIFLDRKMHFTGIRGRIWRLFGIGRSEKNPNVCNV